MSAKKTCENTPEETTLYEEVVYWCQKAAELGDASAQNNLGFCYEKGEGVAQSYEKAVYWYQKAAEQGYLTAQFNLGVCYENGEGVAQSREKAVYWWQKAAAQGDKNAIEALRNV